MATHLRKQLFVDPQVQGQLLKRVALYWVMCLITIVFMVFCYEILTGPVRPVAWHVHEISRDLGPALVASFLLLPLVMMDIVRLSNRFAGPLYRLRRSLRALGKGEPVDPIRFRQGDFWQEFADEFNAVVERIQKLEATVRTFEHSKKREEGQSQASSPAAPLAVPSMVDVTFTPPAQV